MKTKTLFESPSHSITAFHAAGGSRPDSCAVLFSSLSGRALGGKVGGTDVLLRAGIDVISVQTKVDDWHQGIPPKAYDELATLLIGRYAKRYGYGSSMGGYGALLFAARLELDVVLAMSPQYSIAEDFDRRWRRQADRIRWRYDMSEAAAACRGQVFVTYDPYDLDARHFSLIEENFRFARVTGIPVRFGSHPTTAYFHDMGNLKEILVETLTKADFPDLSLNGRENRTYLSALSRHLLDVRNKPASALKAAKACLSLGNTRHFMYRHVSAIHDRLGDAERSVEFARMAAEAPDNDDGSRAAHLEYLASVQRRSGDPEGALESIDKLLELDGSRSLAHTTKSLILFSLDETARAFESIEKALELGDTRHSTFRHLSRLHARVGDFESAVRHAQEAVDASGDDEAARRRHLEHLVSVQHEYIARLSAAAA